MMQHTMKRKIIKSSKSGTKAKYVGAKAKRKENIDALIKKRNAAGEVGMRIVMKTFKERIDEHLIQLKQDGLIGEFKKAVKKRRLDIQALPAAQSAASIQAALAVLASPAVQAALAVLTVGQAAPAAQTAPNPKPTKVKATPKPTKAKTARKTPAPDSASSVVVHDPTINAVNTLLSLAGDTMVTKSKRKNQRKNP